VTTTINITPRFEHTVEGNFIVQVAYCRNCGVEVTRRRFSDATTPGQAHENAAEDGARFLAHLDTHYPKTGPEN
jgi:hypothetical protein